MWPSEPSGLQLIPTSIKRKFHLHSELDVLMDTGQIAKKVNQLAWTKWPDDERVVHLVKLAERLVGRIL